MAEPLPARIRLPSSPALDVQDCRLLIDSVADYAIFMLDPDGFVISWNLGAERIKGYEPQEIIGRHFSRFYCEEDATGGKPQRILLAARKHGRHEDEGWRLRKDGSRFWACVTVTALFSPDGSLRGFGKVTRDLSAKRVAEEELRASEERFRLLVENVVDYAIYMLDLGGRITTWNLGAERMKGYGASEILGRNFDVFFPEEARAEGKPQKELEITRERGRFEDEGWRVRKDGTRFWANAVLTATRDARGRLMGFTKITRDLTARREAEVTERRLVLERAAREAAEASERELRLSELRYRALSRRLEVILDGVADAILVQDRAGKLVYANRAAAAACELESTEALLHVQIEGLLDRFEVIDERGSSVERTQLPGNEAISSNTRRNTSLYVRNRRTREERWYQVRACPVMDEDGTPELSVSIWQDVTLETIHEFRWRCLADATAALSSSLHVQEMANALAKVLIHKLADVCWVDAVSGGELRCVATATPADDTEQESFLLAREHQAPTPEMLTSIWRVFRSGTSEVLRLDGNQDVRRFSTEAAQTNAIVDLGLTSILLTPMRIRNQVFGVITLFCVGSRRQFGPTDLELLEEIGQRAGVALENASLYATTRDAAAAAEAASRMKDEFLATVSHELRTPLNAIVGWASILKDRVEDPTMVRPVQVIHRNAVAQVKIIDDILDVSRIVTGKLRMDVKPTELVSVVREAVEVIRPSAAGKRIAIQFDSPHQPYSLNADPERLQQVVWNLLSNAVKFTGAGGHVGLALRDEGGYVVLSVSDTGNGIAPDFLPYVFDRFRQADSSTSRKFGGLGLGLALVRHIVELHGGTVTAESAGLGLGATFTLKLPLPKDQRAEPESVPKRPAASATCAATLLQDVHVVVVEDDPDARELFTTILTKAGAHVRVAASAAEGLRLLEGRGADVLVSDVGMPDEDGYALLRRIRQHPTNAIRGIPALALTALAGEEDRSKAVGAGFTSHLGKPVDPTELVDSLATLVRGASRRSTS
jgi:PAS domain S-box-containing protein